MRSRWKILFNFMPSFDNHVIIHRTQLIEGFHVGQRMLIDTGRAPFSIVIKEDMVGFKFGEFAATKIYGSQIHMDKKSKKKRIVRR